MQAGPLDVPPVALGRRVVQGEQQPVPALGQERPGDRHDQGAGQALDPAADAVDQAVARPEVLTQAGGAQPAGDGATALGEQQAGQQGGKAGVLAGVEGERQRDNPGGQVGRELAQ